MSRSNLSRRVFALGAICLAGLTYFLWPVSGDQLSVVAEQEAVDETREAADVDPIESERVSIRDLPKVEPQWQSESIELKPEHKLALEGIVLLPNGSPAPAGFRVIAATSKMAYPPRIQLGGATLDLAGWDNVAYTKNDGTFEFPAISRAEKWRLMSGGDFMLSTESTWHEFKGTEGLIPVQLCEVVGGRVELVDQFGESLLEKTSLLGPGHEVPSQKNWKRIGKIDHVLSFLPESIVRAGIDEMILYRALQGELSTLELQCGQSWPGYVRASASFEFDTIRNGIETHQLVLRDTGVNRGDVRFTLVGLPMELLNQSKSVFWVEFFADRSLFHTAANPNEPSATLRGIPLGTYNYLFDVDHQIGRGDGTAQVELAGSLTEVEIDVSDRGSLDFGIQCEDGESFDRFLELKIEREDGRHDVGFVQVHDGWERIHLLPAGRYKLSTQSFRRQHQLEELQTVVEVIAGKIVNAELALPKEYIDALEQ